jgi:hypothetical protein
MRMPARSDLGKAGGPLGLATLAALVVLLLLGPSLTPGSVGPAALSSTADRVVNAHPAKLVYNASEWRVRVSEKGLAELTTWRATVAGTTKHTNSSLNTFQLPNGTYPFVITNVSGYTVSPQSGTVMVAGANVTIDVVFTSNATAGDSLIAKYWWAGAIVVVVLLLLVVALLARRSRRRQGQAPPEAWSPPEAAGEAPPAPEAEPPLPPPPPSS